MQTGRQAGRQRGSAERPTCYLLKVHIQLKLSRYGGAVLLAGFPAVAAARSLSRRGAAEAHVAELDVLSEEEPAVCGHGTQSTSPQQQGNKRQPSEKHVTGTTSFYCETTCALPVTVCDVKDHGETLWRSKIILRSKPCLIDGQVRPN